MTIRLALRFFNERLARGMTEKQGMSLVVTGSIGIDTVETPHGSAHEVLGGSAIYFSLAASFFSPVRMVAAVGEDFDLAHLETLHERGIDTSAIEVRRGSRTFRWHGRYDRTMNDRETVSVELNVLGERAAVVPTHYGDSRYVFLANTHPAVQRGFADAFQKADLIVCDTMDLWIGNELQELRQTLRRVHGVVLNEGEARLLTGETHLVKAGRAILTYGPRFVVIKKGEHGSLLVSGDDLFVAPAYPTLRTIDPTGCGDTFAGAMMGHLAASGRHDAAALRAALLHGSVAASYVIESFSVDALKNISRDALEERYRELVGMTRVG